MQLFPENWKKQTVPLERYITVLLLILAVFLPRIGDLGTMLTIDEPLWQSRAGRFIQAVATGMFADSLVAGQPGITTTWIVGATGESNSLKTSQAAIAIFSGVLLLIVTYFLILVWGWQLGTAAGFLLALNPFLIAHNRVVHTDGLLALFYLASLCALLAGLFPAKVTSRIPIRRYIIFSAILAALALLTKLFALLLIPTSLCIISLPYIQKKYSFNTLLRLALLWLGTLTLTFYLLWPALWFDTDKVFTYLTGRTELHAAGIRQDEITTKPWYYAREVFFRITPVTTIFTVWGLITFFRKKKLKSIYTAGIILFSGIAYILAMSTSSEKSDRYVLFGILALDVFAAFGIQSFYFFCIEHWTRLRKHLFLLFIVPVVYLAATDARLHPYYLAYYNQLYPIGQSHKLGWGEGLEQAATWIYSQDPSASVASYYARVFKYFYPGSVDSTGHIDNKNYLVLYRSMLERGPDSPDTELLNEYLYNPLISPVHTIYINNLPYVWIFKLSN